MEYNIRETVYNIWKIEYNTREMVHPNSTAEVKNDMRDHVKQASYGNETGSGTGK